MWTAYIMCCISPHPLRCGKHHTEHRLVGEKPNDPMVCIPMIGLYPKISITKNACLFFRNPTKKFPAKNSWFSDISPMKSVNPTQQISERGALRGVACCICRCLREVPPLGNSQLSWLNPWFNGVFMRFQWDSIQWFFLIAKLVNMTRVFGIW